MGRNLIIAVFVIVATLICAVSMFVIQNGERTTQLSLDLVVMAWELKEPVSIPLLIGLSVGAGALLPSLYFGGRNMLLAGKVRRLEQERAIAGGEQQTDDWR